MWTTFRAIPASFFPTLRLVGAVALLSTGVAACSGGGNPTGPTPTPDPGPVPVPVPVPAPRTETRYFVDVTVRYIDISPVEACDGRIPIVNAINEGEFQYRIEASASEKQRASVETDDYNTLLGHTILRGAGGRINFTNRTWSFHDLKEVDVLDITLRSTEWDTPVRDARMNDRSNLIRWPMDRGLTGRTGLEVSVGTDTCGMTLVYDMAVERREVPM